MRRTFVPWMIVLAVGFTAPAVSLGFEPLSEAELDRTVASGVQAPLSSDAAQGRRVPVSEKDPAAGEPEDEGTRAEAKTSDSDEKITLIAYREALPVVMNRMTNAPRGPLGRNGSYSLSAPPAVRGQKPTMTTHVLPLAPLIPLPSGFVFFAR